MCGSIVVKVESLMRECDMQEAELEKSRKKSQEAMVLAAEESAKCKAAKDVIKSLTAQVRTKFVCSRVELPVLFGCI